MNQDTTEELKPGAVVKLRSWPYTLCGTVLAVSNRGCFVEWPSVATRTIERNSDARLTRKGKGAARGWHPVRELLRAH
jgi:hypothetical protein